MKTSNSVLSAVIVSVLGLSATLGAPQAYAEDQKIYTGTQCRPSYPSDFDKINSPAWGVFVAPYVTEGAFVSCPITRDNVSNLNGTKQAIVYVFERDPGQEGVICGLTSYDAFGNQVESRQAGVPVGARNFQELNVDVNASANLGYYALACYLPPESGIYSYRINEY